MRADVALRDTAYLNPLLGTFKNVFQYFAGDYKQPANMEKSEAFIEPSSKIRRLERKKEEQKEKPLCLYGSSCFSRSLSHLKAYRHPEKNNYNVPTLPPCKYGANCYDRNLLHFAMYYHPTTDPASDQSSKNGRSERDLTQSTEKRETSKVDKSIANECLMDRIDGGRQVTNFSIFIQRNLSNVKYSTLHLL